MRKLTKFINVACTAVTLAVWVIIYIQNDSNTNKNMAIKWLANAQITNGNYNIFGQSTFSTPNKLTSTLANNNSLGECDEWETF